MFTIMQESCGDTVGVRAEGKLTDKDYKETLIPTLDALFREYGKLNLLFYMDDTFEGWDLDAAWDDASFGLKHRADFGKMAVVGGPAWVEWFIKLSAFLLSGEVRTYSANELDSAWEWIRG